MAEIERIERYMNEHLEEFMEVLEGAVSRESPSYEDKAVSDACGRYLREAFEREGFQVEVIPQTENGDHLVAHMGGGAGGTLCVGHYDTVFPIGFLKEHPFRVEGDRAYGPGILDMKGGIIMGLFAVKALKELGLLPDKRITFFLNGDEESGSFHSSGLIVAEAKRHDNVIVLEPGYDEPGSIKRSRYGRATYEIIAHGRSAHSGTNPEYGINPLEELAYQLQWVKGFHDLARGVSVAPTFFLGGVRSACVIPETASFAIDVRTRDVDLQREIDAEIRGIQPHLEGITLEIKGGIDKPVLPAAEELIARAGACCQALGVPLIPMECKGGSDGNFTGGAGCPTLDGMGMSGLYLHTPNEYINVPYIAKRTAVVAELLRTI